MTTNPLVGTAPSRTGWRRHAARPESRPLLPLQSWMRVWLPAASQDVSAGAPLQLGSCVIGFATISCGHADPTLHIAVSPCSITPMTSHILVCAMLAWDLPYAVSCAALEKGLMGVARAMRRREVLQRADELVPHSVGRVLLALAASVADRDEGCKSVTCSAPAHDVHILAGELCMHVQNITSATCSGASNRIWLAAVCCRHMRECWTGADSH